MNLSAILVFSELAGDVSSHILCLAATCLRRPGRLEGLWPILVTKCTVLLLKIALCTDCGHEGQVLCVLVDLGTAQL